jgi:IclR family transcriptional regulator, KDG regulon repressor
MKHPRTVQGKYVVEAVAKAFEVLESFHGSEEVALGEVSRRVSLNKSRTFRLLHTMAERGYIERSDDGSRYRLGMKLFERAFNVHRDLQGVARGAMLELNEKFNEVVNLAVLDDGDVIYLEIVEASRPFHPQATVGCRTPVHRAALGKAMLAFLSPENVEQRIGRLVNEISARQASALQRELDQIRRRGYAVDDEDNESGVGCIAAPIFDATDEPVAAIGVSGSAHRILTRGKVISQAVVSGCGRVSRSLGFSGSYGSRDTGSADDRVDTGL